MFLFLAVCSGDVNAEFLAALFVSLGSALVAVCNDFADDISVMWGLFSWLMIGAGCNVFSNFSGLWGKVLFHPFFCGLSVRTVSRSGLSVNCH